MLNRELKEYLKNFPDDADVVILTAAPKERKMYPAKGFGMLDIDKFPCLVIELGEGKDMDADLRRICEEEEAAQDDV